MHQSPLWQNFLPRRRFLKWGVAIAGIATTTTYFLSKEHATAYQTNFGTLLVFDQDTADSLYKFAETILPQKVGWSTPKQVQLVSRLDEELYFVSEDIRENIVLALNTLEYLPMTQRVFSRFSIMSLPDRKQFLNALEDTRSELIQLVISGLKSLCFAIYYGHSATWEAIGYDGSFSKLDPQLGVQRTDYLMRTSQIGGNQP